MAPDAKPARMLQPSRIGCSSGQTRNSRTSQPTEGSDKLSAVQLHNLFRARLATYCTMVPINDKTSPQHYRSSPHPLAPTHPISTCCTQGCDITFRTTSTCRYLRPQKHYLSFPLYQRSPRQTSDPHPAI
ncbi:MAG: hypothetical protein FRX48_04538 [Lasallia pustulata]|uniref:Uncharacterized protein n=1 Tax=Lasallia pustulata TaxID=136370 RepID=A0A5M8PP24_9LECA|nr:MAG: hypothetical protein FRX48_04538 [Lasallia pustulata]